MTFNDDSDFGVTGYSYFDFRWLERHSFRPLEVLIRVTFKCLQDVWMTVSTDVYYVPFSPRFQLKTFLWSSAVSSTSSRTSSNTSTTDVTTDGQQNFLLFSLSIPCLFLKQHYSNRAEERRWSLEKEYWLHESTQNTNQRLRPSRQGEHNPWRTLKDPKLFRVSVQNDSRLVEAFGKILDREKQMMFLAEKAAFCWFERLKFPLAFLCWEMSVKSSPTATIEVTVLQDIVITSSISFCKWQIQRSLFDSLFHCLACSYLGVCVSRFPFSH